VPVEQFSAFASQGSDELMLASSGRATTVRAYAKRAAALTRQFCSILGTTGLTTLVAGVVAAIACTLWAVRLDVPLQVALLAGYITLAATACICAALIAVRYSGPATDAEARNVETEAAVQPSQAVAVAANAEAVAAVANAEAVAVVANAEVVAVVANDEADAAVANDEPDVVAKNVDTQSAAEIARPDPGVKRAKPKGARKRDPDYAVWRNVGELRVADAARLWCGIEPGCHATAEVMDWASTILDAIERGELAKSDNTAILAQYKNGWHTAIQTDALKAWATSKGYSPRFLVD
jgi:hypothetical protein